MEGVEHHTVSVNGINMHYAEKGDGPAILFLHGFPELWYSWRHQILALADKGYRCIAPDLRGYGDTDAPASVTGYTVFHIVGDVVALIEALGQQEVFVVGHDWGAIIAWQLCLFRPDRVKALVNLSVAYRLFFSPGGDPIEYLRQVYGDDYYMYRFQKPGEIEAEFSTVDPAILMNYFLAKHDPGPLLIPKGSIARLPEMNIPRPSWISEEDIEYYASKFRNTGYTGGVNYYRMLSLDAEMLAVWMGAQVRVPTKFVIGDQDLTYSMPGVKDYIHGEQFKKDVPLLKEVVVLEGAAHWINQERADEITDHIYNFIIKF
ncbi:hypothetical protein H6P81_003927 [Aristolochia fimbriata]|uniref:soluble epoxide hydrolase n=1 Tax=Aristolochia fimbriata TaxID=158543 RepID=A0AAV7FEH4_ARIFI|nr:hypothetical protein H6P81_003927 [Aristolochia fimbriata]